MWANDRVVKACAEVADADYFADKGAFFKSMHGTLNHLIVVDRLWLARMKGEKPAAVQLDAVLYEDFQGTRKARRAQDKALIDHVAALSDETAMANVTYRNLAGEVFNTPHAFLVATVVNHGTHHRGQLHALLTQGGYAAPVLDLPPFLRTAH
jgi:uncharacterized damage-inducible protein DinB